MYRSPGAQALPPRTQSALRVLTGKLNAYDGVTATVEPSLEPRRAGRDRQRPRQRPREHRAGRARRTSSSSRTSSSDPGDSSEGDPEPPPSDCDCGCGRDISHKRADARIFNSACQKRLTRRRETAAGREPDTARWERTLPLATEAEQIMQAVASGELAERTGRPQVAALVRAREDMLGLDTYGARRCEQLHGDAVYRDPDGDAICLVCGRYRGMIASRINGFDATFQMMKSNGTHVPVAGLVVVA